VSAAAAEAAVVPPDIHVLLNGEMADKYGVLPVVPLPQEDELLKLFCVSMGQVLGGKPIYRRDRVMVIPNLERARLDELSPEMFCSWSQDYVVTSKIKHDKNGEAYSVMKDMPTEAAAKVLCSTMFVPYIRAIEEVHAVPKPKLVGDDVVLMAPGFDGGIYTFDVQ